MSSPSVRASGAESTRVSAAALWFGLFGAPAFWSVQVMSGFAVTAHGCFPRALPLASPTLDVRVILLLITVIATIGAVAAGLTAHASWRRVAHDAASERTRFMTFSGMLVSALFLLAIVLSFVSILMVPPCAYGS